MDVSAVEVLIGGTWYTYNAKICQVALDEYVSGAIRLINCGMDTLPSLPTIVSEVCCIYHNRITSLVGSPEVVGGYFSCYANQLTSLVGGPKVVYGNYICSRNPLESLEGAPDILTGMFISDQFTDEDYRKFVAKRDIIRHSNDEAGIGSILDVL